MRPTIIGLGLALLVTACGSNERSPKVHLAVGAAPAVTAPIEKVEEVQALTPAVSAKISEIRTVLERDSLNRLVVLASGETNFMSNLAGEPHKVHWDLLRRTGFDPLHRLDDLLEGPYGTRQVGNETWYIWPDFAARDADDLLPEKLNYTDRARLSSLVGAPGLARIRNGQDYPGIRTAIAEDGRWLYFVHETIEDTKAHN